MSEPKNLIVLSAPSGGGKSTVARHLMRNIPNLEFSISATTRKKRPREVEGKDYYFISKEEFEKKIEAGELVEYEEIFGNYYGTLKSTVDKALKENRLLLFDIDVKGALSIKKLYPKKSLLVFLSPPSLGELERRLKGRGAESEEQIRNRLDRVKTELELKKDFDVDILNKDLNATLRKALDIVKSNVRQ